MKNSIIGGIVTLALCVVLLPAGDVFAATPAPECVSFKASETRVERGDRVKLSWTTDHATRIELDPGSYKSTIESTVESGDVTVFPKETTKYTLTASRGSSEDTCSVTVRIDSDTDGTPATTVKFDTKKDDASVTAFVTRDQQPLTSVAISAIPYTGVDMTPYLATLFFALLAAWGYSALRTFRARENVNISNAPSTYHSGTSSLIPHKEYYTKFIENPRN